MDISSLLPVVISFLGQIPYVGPVIVTILGLALPLSAIVTALVLMWQAIVKLMIALSLVIPGLKPVAEKLKVSEDEIEGVMGKIKSVFLTLSVIPVPTKKSEPSA